MKQVRASLILLCSLSIVGCNNAMTTDSFDLKSGDPNLDQQINTQDSEAKAREAEKMIQEVNNLLDLLDLELGINNSEISLFRIGALKNKIQAASLQLQQQFQQAGTNLSGLKDRLKQLKDGLKKQIAILDPTIPEHAAAIAKLQTLIAQLDMIETKIDMAVDRLMAKVDELGQKLDELIARVGAKLGTAGIPVEILLFTLKDEMLIEVKAKLTELLGL